MKKHKITATLYYVAAILSYISAVINFAGENSNYMAGLWICIGSTSLWQIKFMFQDKLYQIGKMKKLIMILKV